MVIEKIKELLGLVDEAQALDDETDDVELAAAALLVEVAVVDKEFDLAERDRILRFVKTKFSVEEIIAKKLISRAEAEVESSVQLYGITSALRHGLSYEDRVELMECLWTVAYADGEIDPFEDQLMRRIGELIYVTDRDRGTARKKAMDQN
jgi:uncharacterized tellurite resistance protein B-like protein